MKNFIFSFVLILLITTLSNNLYSLPRFSLRTGGTCIDCHVNPSGGNIRNESGWSYGKNNLVMFNTFKVEEETEGEFESSNFIGKNILFGLDLRTQYLYTQSSPIDSTSKSDFQKMTGSLYFNIIATENIDIFTRYDFIHQIWEAYGIAKILPLAGYVKAGQFSPNYGIRLDDHTSYTRGGDLGVLFSKGTRQGLIYDPRYVETGVEVGFSPLETSLFTVSVGNSGSRTFEKDPSYHARFEIISTPSDDVNFLFGGSYANFKERKFDRNSFKFAYENVSMYGGFFGVGFDQFTLIGEYNIADNLIQKDSTSIAYMIEASYRITKGLEAILRYDSFDFNSRINKDELAHLIIGLEFFPYSFVELRPQYRINIEDPSFKNDAIVLQFHFWY